MSSVDIVVEGINDINKIAKNNDKTRLFYGDNEIFMDKEKDDWEYFKNIRAIFGAHLTKLKDNNEYIVSTYPTPCNNQVDISEKTTKRWDYYTLLWSKEKSHNFWENSILLWEEPEFYLTPQQERACYEALSQNTKLGLMAIVSTNSSRFIELGNYQSLCIFRRIKEEVEICQYGGTLFSGDEVTVFNMNYWINPDRSELFFAKKVILVEGQTDKIVLSYLAKNLGIYNYNYSIIECGSKSSIPQFIRLLNAFHIPYVAVYDKDNHYWRNEIELENSTLKNKIIQKLVWKKLGEWVEFENDIQEEIYDESRDKKNYKNKPFYALETVINPKYIVPKRLEEKVRKIFE